MISRELPTRAGIVTAAALRTVRMLRLAARFRQKKLPYALEPVTNVKAPRIAAAIPGCQLVKPNQSEARVLTGIDCTSVEEAGRAARRLAEGGAGSVASEGHE